MGTEPMHGNEPGKRQITGTITTAGDNYGNVCELLHGKKKKKKSQVICSAHVRQMKQHESPVGECDVEVH